MKRGIFLLCIGLGVFGIVRFLFNEYREVYPNMEASTREVFYEGKTKQWAHRANNSADANVYLKEFPGIELDVFYDDLEGGFYVKHDEDGQNTETLEEYFSKINKVSSFYYWLDLKNLGFKNEGVINKRLQYLTDKYNIRDKLIIESSRSNVLGLLGDDGFYVSLWIPSFVYNSGDSLNNYEKVKDIRRVLSKHRFNAISAHVEMKPFFDDYLSNCTKHYWTNGLDKNELHQFLNECEKDTTVKVVLVDVE